MSLSNIFSPDIYFLKSIIASNFKRLSFPFKCSFAVTYKCNLKCGMCNIWKKDTAGNEVSLKEIDNFFKIADKFSWVGITGGEPFLRQDLFDIAESVIRRSRNLSVIHFATNGFLTERIISITAGLRKKYPKQKFVFTVSIDGTQKLHDKIRGVNGVWDNAVKTFIQLKNISNIKAQIGFTISSLNVGEFKPMLESLKSAYPAVSFDDININVFQKSGFYYDNLEMNKVNNYQLFEQLKKIFSYDDKSLSINNFLRRAYLKMYPAYLRDKRTPVKCQALSSTLFIDPYGDIYPCAIFKKKLININDIRSGFSAVWGSEKARQISKECIENKCPVCWSPCDAFSAISGSLLKSLRGYFGEIKYKLRKFGSTVKNCSADTCSFSFGQS